MPQSSSLGILGTGSHSLEIQAQAMSAPQRAAMIASGAEIRASSGAAMREEPDDVRQTVPRTTLTVWNAILFLFHAGLAALTLAVGNTDLEVPVYRSAIDFRYVRAANETASGDDDDTPWELVPVYLSGGTLMFTWWVAAFFVLSATFHLLNATLLRRVYLDQLERCYTPTRWIEYFFSASVMIVVVAYTLGIRDRDTLVALAALVATTMTFGYWVEVVGRPRSADEWRVGRARRLLPWALGHVPQCAAWALIVLRFYDVLSEEDRAPAFVHAILWGELVLFFSFGLASLLSQLYPPRLFYRGEITFQVLSLVSKGLLGGLLIANVLMYSSFDEIYN